MMLSVFKIYLSIYLLVTSVYPAHRIVLLYVYLHRQKYKTTLKNEEKDIVYNFFNYENQINKNKH